MKTLRLVSHGVGVILLLMIIFLLYQTISAKEPQTLRLVSYLLLGGGVIFNWWLAQRLFNRLENK